MTMMNRYDFNVCSYYGWGDDGPESEDEIGRDERILADPVIEALEIINQPAEESIPEAE